MSSIIGGLMSAALLLWGYYTKDMYVMIVAIGGLIAASYHKEN